MAWIRLSILLVVLALGSGTASADEPVSLRLGTLAVDGSRYMNDVLALSREIEQRTRGAVRLDWVSDGRLGDERAMVDLITAGKLDGGGFSETGLTVLVPDMIVWRYPGLFRTYDEVDRATAALTPEVRDRFAPGPVTRRARASSCFWTAARLMARAYPVDHRGPAGPATPRTPGRAATFLPRPLE